MFVHACRSHSCPLGVPMNTAEPPRSASDGRNNLRPRSRVAYHQLRPPCKGVAIRSTQADRNCLPRYNLTCAPFGKITMTSRLSRCSIPGYIGCEALQVQPDGGLRLSVSRANIREPTVRLLAPQRAVDQVHDARYALARIADAPRCKPSVACVGGTGRTAAVAGIPDRCGWSASASLILVCFRRFLRHACGLQDWQIDRDVQTIPPSFGPKRDDVVYVVGRPHCVDRKLRGSPISYSATASVSHTSVVLL